MDESWPTLGGSDLGAAVRLSIETLRKTGQTSNAMVLITDGEMHRGDIDQMVSEAREAGVYIITVGVGTADGGYVPNPEFAGGRHLDNTELGFNYLVDGGSDVGGGGGGSGFPGVIGPPDVPVGTFPAFNPATVAGSGLRVFGQIGDLSGYLRALSTKTDFTVLSRPSIFTSNNQRGVISSGERIAIPTEGGTNTGNFSSGTRIQYEDVVLRLEVIPLVNSNDEITMQIALLNDEQNGNQIIEGAGTNGGDLTVPRISTREILTTATVPNNETIVLGGLIVGRTNKDKSGIPILMDIPLVGGLFSTNTNGKDRSELLVFIQPSLVGEGNEGLDALQLDMQNRYKVTDSALNFAEGGEGAVNSGSKKAKKDMNPSDRMKAIGPRHRRWRHPIRCAGPRVVPSRLHSNEAGDQRVMPRSEASMNSIRCFTMALSPSCMAFSELSPSDMLRSFLRNSFL